MVKGDETFVPSKLNNAEIEESVINATELVAALEADGLPNIAKRYGVGFDSWGKWRSREKPLRGYADWSVSKSDDDLYRSCMGIRKLHSPSGSYVDNSICCGRSDFQGLASRLRLNNSEPDRLAWVIRDRC